MSTQAKVGGFGMYYAFSATSITGEKNGIRFIASVQGDPVYIDANGKSAFFKIYVRSQSTNELLEEVEGRLQVTLTQVGTVSPRGRPQALLNLASTWAGTLNIMVELLQNGDFGGINLDAGYKYGASLGYLNASDSLSVVGWKMNPCPCSS